MGSAPCSAGHVLALSSSSLSGFYCDPRWTAIWNAGALHLTAPRMPRDESLRSSNRPPFKKLKVQSRMLKVPPPLPDPSSPSAPQDDNVTGRRGRRLLGFVILSEAQRAESKNLGGGSRISYLASVTGHGPDTSTLSILSTPSTPGGRAGVPLVGMGLCQRGIVSFVKPAC